MHAVPPPIAGSSLSCWTTAGYGWLTPSTRRRASPRKAFLTVTGLSARELGGLRRRYAERFPDWRQSTNSYRCPRHVAGLHSHAWTGRGPRCICEDHEAILDHERLWILPSGRGQVFTSDPYHIGEDDLATFRANCGELDLVVTVED